MPEKNRLLIDIDAKIQEGKGMGYQRWAKVFNLKQMAQTVAYLQEHSILDYDDLVAKSADATARYNSLSVQIKGAEKRIAEIIVLNEYDGAILHPKALTAEKFDTLGDEI